MRSETDFLNCPAAQEAAIRAYHKRLSHYIKSFGLDDYIGSKTQGTVLCAIVVGDLVWSENPDTGERALKRVVQTFVNETDELVRVRVNGEEIITTPEHPFYVPS